MRRRLVLILASAGLSLGLAACTAVGPDYAAPETAMAEEWLEPASTEPVDPQWWQRFNDPLLTALVERAFADNPDLAEASARLAEARALREAALGERLPEGAAVASATANRISENGQFPVANIPGFDPAFSLFDLGFDASWEIDLWGGTARGIEAATAREEAALWARRDAMVMLAAEVARTYVDYRAAQARAALGAEEAETAAALAELTQLLFEAGEAARDAADRAHSAKDSAEARLASLQADVAGAEYRLAVLAGATPQEIVPDLRASQAPVPPAPAVIAAGIRSDLLKRRPDIRRAERELAAASAQIGVATAQLYPSFTLIGGIGLHAQEPDNLPDTDSLRYSVGPGFSWPIFSMGRLRAQIRAADARAQAAAARYEAAIIGALSDSESAANRYAAASAAARAAAAALAREQSAFALEQMRVESGEDSRLQLEQARQRLSDARRQELQAHAANSAAAIAFYKALGGGWE